MFALRNRETGAVLVEDKMHTPASEWTKYTAHLSPPNGTERRLQAVDFSVAVGGDGRNESTGSLQGP